MRRRRVEWEGGALQQQVGADGHFRILPPLLAGDHVITIAVRDAAGNISRSRRHLRFDDQPPVLPDAGLADAREEDRLARARRAGVRTTCS